MARLVCVALVCWPTPFHMYMLTGRLCARSSAVCQTLSAGTQGIFSERSGANSAAISPRRSKTGLQEISSPFLSLIERAPKSAGDHAVAFVAAGSLDHRSQLVDRLHPRRGIDRCCRRLKDRLRSRLRWLRYSKKTSRWSSVAQNRHRTNSLPSGNESTPTPARRRCRGGVGAICPPERRCRHGADRRRRFSCRARAQRRYHGRE